MGFHTLVENFEWYPDADGHISKNMVKFNQGLNEFLIKKTIQCEELIQFKIKFHVAAVKTNMR